MKLSPSFADHWKTDMLVDAVGPEGVVALLRLWGRTQIQREWTGLDLSPEILARITKWKGDALTLWNAFIEGPWIVEDGDGTWTVYGWADHQKQVIHLWEAGKKGGRPRNQVQTKRKPLDNHGLTMEGKSKRKRKSKEGEGAGEGVLPHGPRFAEAWATWEQHRKEIKKPLTPTSTKVALKKLDAMPERDAIKMIEHTIANGWQGLREPEAPRGNPNRVAKANPGGTKSLF